jgi:hypothetical protein
MARVGFLLCHERASDNLRISLPPAPLLPHPKPAGFQPQYHPYCPCSNLSSFPYANMSLIYNKSISKAYHLYKSIHLIYICYTFNMLLIYIGSRESRKMFFREEYQTPGREKSLPQGFFCFSNSNNQRMQLREIFVCNKVLHCQA